MEENLSVNGLSYTVLRLLGRGKGGYSYLVSREGQEFVLKQIHHEPCDYYTFGDKLAAELGDYEKLLTAGIRIPRLLAVDREQERLLKEYIPGDTVMELCQKGLLTEALYAQGRQMAELAMAAGLNIDYECNPYMDKWSFAQWGSSYWKNRREETL